MKPLKDIYTHRGIFSELTRNMKKVYPDLPEKLFYEALVENLDSLELKARIERAADVCRRFLPQDYLKALDVLYRFAEGKPNRLIYFFLSTFVAKFGKNYYSKSMTALRDFTQYSSSEEAVRTFIEMNPAKTFAAMREWARSKNVHIRRLSSEGSRPRLPWAKKILLLIEKPELTWDILETLKQDPEKYVQKSVANHINDISKDHPDWIVQKLKRWNLSNHITRWIAKHGLRTLIKKGHKGALSLLGHGQKPRIEVRNIQWDKRVRMGSSCSLTFHLISKNMRPQPLIIDYHIHFYKKNGRPNLKTFKLKKYTLAPKEIVRFQTKYTFKDMTTRKHYPGPHAWQLMVNGQRLKPYPFTVH